MSYSVKEVQKKPVIVEAVQYDGSPMSVNAIFDWVRSHVDTSPVRSLEHVTKPNSAPYLIIETLEGAMRAAPGWWVIRGVHGEFYPCDPDIFEETYNILGDL